MVQHGINTEFEVWTAFVMEHNREQHWYSLAEDLGNLMSSIKTEFQAQVKEYLGLADSGYMISEKAFNVLGPFVAAMYTVTEQEVTQWKETRLVSFDEDSKNAPLITYPWLFSRELGKIATRQSGPSAVRAAFAASGEIRRTAPVVKSNYKAELHSIKLEPLTEWKPENAVVDHVGKTAFDVAATEKLEKQLEKELEAKLEAGLETELEMVAEDDGAVDKVAEKAAEKIAEEDAVDGADAMKAAEMKEKEEQDMEKQGSVEQKLEDQSSEGESLGDEATKEQKAEEEEEDEADKGAMDNIEPQGAGGEEEGANAGAGEVDNAYDRLMAMMSL